MPTSFVYKVPTATVIPGGTWNLTTLLGGHEKGVDLIRIIKNRENTWNFAQKCIFYVPHLFVYYFLTHFRAEAE